MSSRVSTSRRTAAIGLTIASLVGGAALSGMVASTATAATGDQAYDKVIAIKTTSRGGTITKYNGTVNPSVQNIASAKQGCELISPTTDPVVATFAGSSSAKVGYNSGSIGVIEKSGSGQACGQVNYLNADEEVLTIDLKGSTANIAALDMEVQKDAKILATTYEKGNKTATLRTFELQSGASVGASSQAAQVFVCNVETSSAPNSNITDNCRWLFGGLGPFDVVELKALRGQFSLEGGADGIVPKAPGEPAGVPANVSYFKLGALCNDVNTSTTISSTGGVNYPDGSVKRYENVDGSICFDDELTATAVDANTVDIIKKGQPYAQYIVKIAWEKAPTTATALSEAISQTTIQFDNGGGVLSTERKLPWCPTSLFNGTTSLLDAATGGRVLKTVVDMDTVKDGIADELASLNVTDMDGLGTNSVQFACIQDRHVNYDAGTFYVNDVIYVIGDLRMRG